jgi:hypothetical protein
MMIDGCDESARRAMITVEAVREATGLNDRHENVEPTRTVFGPAGRCGITLGKGRLKTYYPAKSQVEPASHSMISNRRLLRILD